MDTAKVLRGILQVQLIHFSLGIVYTPWSSWESRPGECEVYGESRSRKCIRDCINPMIVDRRACHEKPRAYETWSQWSECSVDCGVGFKYRESTNSGETKVQKEICVACSLNCNYEECIGLSRGPRQHHNARRKQRLPVEVKRMKIILYSMEDKIKKLEASEENMLSRLSKCEEKLSDRSINQSPELTEVIREQKILSQKLGHQAERIDRILPISKRSSQSRKDFLMDEQSSSDWLNPSDLRGDLRPIVQKIYKNADKIENIHDNMEQICQKLLKPAITKALTSRDNYIKINHSEISEIKKNVSTHADEILKLKKDLMESSKASPQRPSGYSTGSFDRKYVDEEVSKMNIYLENRIQNALNELQNTNYEIRRLRDIVDTYNSRTDELQRQVTFQRRTPNEDEISRKLKILQDSQPRIRKLEQDNFDGQVKMRDMESRVFELESKAKNLAEELMNTSKSVKTTGLSNIAQNTYDRVLMELRRINDEIQDLKYSNSNLKLSINGLDKENIVERAYTESLWKNMSAIITKAESRRQTYAFEYTIGPTQMKMESRPHPFGVAIIDRSNGAYLTSGKDCYAPGGATKNYSCLGVFRAPVKGLYKFSLLGCQWLANARKSHFTGWLRKNGRGMTGSYSNSGDVAKMKEGALHSVSLEMLLELEPGDEVSTLFVAYMGSNKLYRTKSNHIFNSFSGYCIDCE